MRFWISAVSLKRPPTLFTISSLFNASIIGSSLWQCVAGYPLAVASIGKLPGFILTGSLITRNRPPIRSSKFRLTAYV
jgi:hypothetical protein